MKYLLALIALVAGTMAAVPEARAQDAWPSRPVRWIVPYPAGGTVDQVARLLADKAHADLKQAIVIENRPGASGMLGTTAVAKAAPDGYTWGFVFDHHVVNPSLIANMPFDTRKDLDPVMLVAQLPMLIVTNSAQPYRSFTDVVAAAKAKPGTITFASTGSGSLAHLMITLLQKENDFQLVHVPYKGGPPAVKDLLGGHVPLYAASPVLVLEHVRAGKLRPLAYTGAKRSPLLPDVPTLAEQGFRSFQAQSFIGVVAPAGTPKPISNAFHNALASALKSPDVVSRISALGVEPVGSSQEEFAKYLVDETQRWGKVIRDNGIRLD